MKPKYAALAMFCLLAGLLSTAHAVDHQGMTPKGVIQKARKGVLRVQVAEVTDAAASVSTGGGSGFIFEIDYDKGIAYAITNYHVAGHASYVSATTWNKTIYNGEMVAAEPGIDIALIRLHGIPDERNLSEDQKTVIPIVLGDSDKVVAGEQAVAMGSPGAQEIAANRSDPDESFMMDQTATSNVVTGRFTPLDWSIMMWGGGQNGLNYEYSTNVDYQFRMSTTINHGNSGGPLLNNRGEVIGINTWGLYGTNEDTNHQDDNLSVPINLAKDFVYQILNTGKFQKPWLGIDLLFPPTIMMGSVMGGVDTVGTYHDFIEKHRTEGRLDVYGVRKDSPADKAGLKSGDVISEINGQKFKTPEEVRLWVFSQDIGKQLTLKVLRNGKLMPDPIVMSVGAKRSYDSEFSI